MLLYFKQKTKNTSCILVAKYCVLKKYCYNKNISTQVLGQKMKYSHSQQRAAERYFIENFNPYKALNEVLSDRCILISESFEKYSRTFLIKYFNKYIVLVTDFNVNYVKTCLPFADNFEYLNKLLEKLNTCDKIAV